MKNLIKSRRGIAIEMAIGVMFVMIALSIVLISISGMQIRHMNNDLNEFNEKIEINEIGEYVCKNMNKYKNATERQNILILDTETNENVDTGYDVQYTDNQYKIYKGDEVVLIIKIDENSNKITSWGN